MEDIDGGLHPAVDGQSLDEDEMNTCIGHFNVYHLYNKCTEVFLLMQKLTPVLLFGISESRIDARNTDNLISINNYTVLRRKSD